jgi:hypothetical protein
MTREIAVEPVGRRAICRVRFGGSVERSETMSDAVSPDSRPPSAPVEINALVAAPAIAVGATIPHVLGVSANAEVCAPIVEPVTVYVINEHAARAGGNHAMEKQPCSTDIRDEVPVAAPIHVMACWAPLVRRQHGHVLVVETKR